MTGKIIVINGKEYKIKFTINTLCDMAKSGLNIMNLSEKDFDIVMIRTLFYYGLKSTDKKITENKAGDLMDEYLQDGHDFGELTTEIMTAFTESLGTKNRDNTDEEDGNTDVK